METPQLPLLVLFYQSTLSLSIGKGGCDRCTSIYLFNIDTVFRLPECLLATKTNITLAKYEQMFYYKSKEFRIGVFAGLKGVASNGLQEGDYKDYK